MQNSFYLVCFFSREIPDSVIKSPPQLKKKAEKSQPQTATNTHLPPANNTKRSNGVPPESGQLQAKWSNSDYIWQQIEMEILLSC